MRKGSVLVCLMLALAVAGCKAAPAPGTPITQAAGCVAGNNDQRVTLDGYPRISGMVMVSDDMGVDLFEQPGGKGQSMTVYLTVGKGANQVEEIPDNFTDADLKIHLSDNSVVGTDHPIKVTGSMLVTPDGSGKNTCLINEIDLIEAGS